MRPSQRDNDQLRPVHIDTNVNCYAEGSCLIQFGNTHVLCTASIDERVPPFLRGKGKGWVTAEYNMLPRATHRRMDREAVKGKQSGRTQEIQRLIGRSLRAVMDLESLGERQIIIDCDVVQADGGTRTAAITGGYVALHLALSTLMNQGKLDQMPIYGQLAAVSCGIVKGQAVLDLDYEEDSSAEVDANFVMTGSGSLVEIQATAEESPFSQEEMLAMLSLAQKGIEDLTEIQRKALGTADMF